MLMPSAEPPTVGHAASAPVLSEREPGGDGFRHEVSQHSILTLFSQGRLRGLRHLVSLFPASELRG